MSAAKEDSAAYLGELAALGLDPKAYEQVRAQLEDQTTHLHQLEARAQKLPEFAQDATRAWQAIHDLYEDRRDRRRALLDQIQDRSGMLRFTFQDNADTSAWVARVRDLLNLRADGFLTDLPALASWLWADAETRAARTAQWRHALIAGDLDALARDASLRSAFARRLAELDPLVRTRLAAEIAEEVIDMDFLRDGGDPARHRDWQPLTAGSPGQRSAAMLSFVLHHGNDPLVLDQPEDDLDTEWITQLVVRQLRASRWNRQVIVITHNANIPVNADAERVVVLENTGRGITVRHDVDEATGTCVEHCGPLEDQRVRADIQQILEGGVEAFIRRERRYNNELSSYRAALRQASVEMRPADK
nr:AAA family ATPase [Blastococcus sp. TF02-8]